VTEHQLVFVGGLHRSGTTLLARAIARRRDVSGFANTGASADEGQHLQSVYPPVAEFGGAGRFGFDDRSHLTQASPLVTDANRERLLAEWSRYWNLEKQVLIEKSPGNMLKLRFLQALFGDAVFIVVMRHPIPVSYATQKWSETSMEELLEHWLVCHELFLADAAHITRLLLVRYEDFVSGPRAVVEDIESYLGLTPVDIAVTARKRMNDPYFQRWDEDFAPGSSRGDIAGRFEAGINRFGYSIEDPNRAVDPAPEVAARLTGRHGH
jgi:hypothetical protein